jgi:hypothetical protein
MHGENLFMQSHFHQIEPPPREFHPMMHDPWPWFDDETGETDWEIAVAA